MRFVIWYSIDGGKRCLRKYFSNYKAAECKLVNTLKRNCFSYNFFGEKRQTLVKNSVICGIMPVSDNFLKKETNCWANSFNN